ncbi:MAG: YDG domain-containing protein, partial [Actinomycetes bacterium]
FSISGAGASNYTVAQPTGLTATITAKGITGSFTASNKVYDGTTAATITSRSLTGTLPGDAVSLSGTATFSDKNVGLNKTVTLGGASLSGAAAGNYELTNSPITTLADITINAITVTADNKSKVVGTSDPALTYAITTGTLGTGDSFSGEITRTAGETIGTYPIEKGTLALSANYALSFIDGTFSIVPEKPAPPTDVKFGPSAGGTLIRWVGSSGATGYQVRAGGRLLGTTGPDTLSLFVPEILGPDAGIVVIALGPKGSASDPAAGAYQPSAQAKLGTVRFSFQSSKLTAGSKSTLRAYARTIAAQGFRNVTINGYTATYNDGGGTWASRKRLSVARAKNVRLYLAAQLKSLHVSPSISTAGYGNKYPAASNKTSWGRMKNRRAEILLK